MTQLLLPLCSFLILLSTGIANIGEELNALPKNQQEIDIYDGVPFDMPEVKDPVFPDREVNIQDFGGVDDGLTKNTEAFAKAIDHLSKQGGGTLLVPRGTWLTGPVVLKSNIRIHTESGTTIVFSEDFEDYPLIKTSFEGLDTWRCLSPIYGKDLENVAITGQGVIDGSGEAWRAVHRDQLTSKEWEKKVASGGIVGENGHTWFPTENAQKGRAIGQGNVPDLVSKEEFEALHEFFRPVMVSLVSCKNVLLDGPTFQNSPAWNLHPLMCENVIIRNLTVRNPDYAHNGDGIDLESCSNVLIYRNSFDVGDDAICFKSGKNEDGLRRAMPTQNVIVRDNIVYHGHGGFVIGSEMSGGVRNVFVANCTFMGTDVGLRFKSTRGRGGIVENIWISDIDMSAIPTEAIRFNMFYGGKSPIGDEMEDIQSVPAEPVSQITPVFRNIHMKNITVTHSQTAAFFQGLPEMNLQNVSLENAIFDTKEGMTMIDADSISLEKVKMVSADAPVLTIFNSKNISVHDFDFGQHQQEVIRLLGNLTDKIFLSDQDFTNPNSEISRGNGVQKSVYSFE